MTRREHIIRKWALIATVWCAAAAPAFASQNSVAAAAGTPALGANTSLMSDSIHLVVGHSMFINTRERLRRIYVANPDVLDSMTSSPTQIVVTAKTPGVTSLILWDELGQVQSYQVTADMDVSDLQRAMKAAFPADTITVTGRQDEVALTGIVTNPADSDNAVKLASQYSKMVTDSLQVAPQHTPQVRLKVRVVEIDRSRLQQLGFNAFGTGKNSFSSSTGQYPVVSALPGQSLSSNSASSGIVTINSLLNLFYYNQDLGLGGAIEALQNNEILQILAEPTITALSGQTASFLSGGEFPFPVIQGASSGFTSVTIQFRPYGVKLDFTPNVLPDGTIQLKVAPEVSALDYTNAVEISGYTVPAISTRRAQTEVELKSGQSFTISGLLDNRTTDIMQKIPGIGDIPVLGKLFQSKNTTHSVVELAVIVTPTLVDPLSENPPPTQPKMVVPFIDDQKFDKNMKGVVPKGSPAQTPTQPPPQQ
ncbi:MAG TPA: type II and III secretion system protein family protein [Acidobacteriaceae bacterium]|nr:type II and III secretion system protein family protein [Acidobacteriaceae bacterium]